LEVCDDDELLKVSEDDEKLLHEGSPELVAPDGLVVTAQLSDTVPVYELPAVTVMVSVFVDPEDTAMLPLLESEKLPLSGACQKSPQPAISAAAAVKPAKLIILITAPCAAHWPRRRSATYPKFPCPIHSPLFGEWVGIHAG
jgi:hypothetical protein